MNCGGSPVRPAATPVAIGPPRPPPAPGAAAAPADEEEAGGLLLPTSTPFLDGAAPLLLQWLRLQEEAEWGFGGHCRSAR
jgi:hypothetical protein